MKHLCKHLFLFITGGCLYYLIEIIWRGYSDISMLVLGGICFVIIGLINERYSWEMPLILQMLLSSAFVTLAELMAGIVLNIWLDLNIWDYSDSPLNLYGQICLSYSLLWFVLSLGAIVLDDLLRWKLFNEEKPHYRFI